MLPPRLPPSQTPHRRVAVLAALAAAAFSTGCDRSAEEAHLAAMAQEHAGDTPVAGGAALAEGVAASAGPIQALEVTYATLEGKPVKGYLARPLRDPGVDPDAAAGRAAHTPPPGLLVIHEWWGLNDHIKSMTRQLASAGYTALAVDLYAGVVADTPAQARELMQATFAQTPALQENLRQAHRFLELEQRAPRTASIGWCFGGGWSLQTALLLRGQLDAAVIYYGRLVTGKATLATLDMPILGHFGSEDRGIPIQGVRAFQSALTELGKDAHIHIYEGADHAFANPSGTRYDAAAAEEAWERTLAFLERTLRR